MSSRRAAAGCGPPALVFGAGVTGLAVLRSLGRSGVPVFAAGSETDKVNLSRWYRSAPSGAIDAASGAGALTSYLQRLPFPRAVLIPATDEWALALASLPEAVADSYPATVASTPVLRMLIDKERFAKTVSELSIPAPRTIPVAGAEDLDGIADAELPRFFLKPCDSQLFARLLGVKGLRLDGRRDAAKLVDRLASEGLDTLLQELVPGPPTAHVFVDGYVDRSSVMRACLARRRLRMHPRPFGNSTLTVTIPLNEVGPAVDSLQRLFDAIGYSGLFDAEFKYDARDGRFKIIEVNARPWWQLELTGVAGLDVCVIAYRDAAGMPLPSAPRYRLGRTWVNPVPDLKAWLVDRRLGGGAGGFPPAYWLGGANAVFSWDDPLPAIAELFGSARRGLAAASARTRAAPVAGLRRLRHHARRKRKLLDGP